MRPARKTVRRTGIDYIDYSVLSIPKPESRKRAKRRKDAEERAVKHDVRAECVKRDGRCRLAGAVFFGRRTPVIAIARHLCGGPGEWAHMVRRSATRRMAPEQRHSTATSLMLCRRAHDQYDGRARPRLAIEPLTGREANGPLRFLCDGLAYEEDHCKDGQ